MNLKENKYQASSIKILNSLEAVRKRPGMYIGDTSDGSGLHHLVFEVLDNSIDEVLAGYCNKIYVIIHSNDLISIIDNGRGIPIDIKMDDKNSPKRSAAEIVMTELHAGGKFNQDSYKVSGGLHGLGVSCVNSLSKFLELTIYKNSKKYIMNFKRGILQNKKIKIINNIKISPIESICKTKKTGTKIKFKVDKKIFKNINFNYKILKNRIKELSFLNNGILIILKDERINKIKSFSFKGGTKEFLKYINKNKKIINKKIFQIKKKKKIKKKKIFIDVSMLWNNSYKEKILCFTNNIPQKEGGTHLTGLKTAITKVINKFIINNNFLKDKKLEITSEDIREGLVCILSIKFPEPKFSSQTKNKLISSEIRSPIEEVITKNLLKFLLENFYDAKIICNKIINIAKIKKSLKKTRDILKKKKNIKEIFLSSKLADCQEKNPYLAELFLVEGDSAGGSAKQGRDRKFQAILPLRGKILNVEKATFEKIISSEQITTLIATLGINIQKKKFNIKKLKYHKIIIMTDADIDGAHIKTLLLTLFFRYMPKLIKNGFIYIAQPPLYKIKFQNKELFLKDDLEKEKYIFKKIIYNYDYILKENYKEIEKNIIKIFFKKYKILQKILFKLSKKIDYSILILILSGIKLKINSTKEIYETYLNLKKKINNKNIKIKIKKKNNKNILKIKNFLNGEIKKTVINNNIINDENYKLIINFSDFFIKIIGKGILIKNKKTKKIEKIFIYNFYKKIKDILLFIEQNIIKQRYKGLGEMNPNQLWETTMNPEKRCLLRVKIENLKSVDKIFNILMGEKVEPRKEFIKLNAILAKNIDI
ncbi:DNA gyrase subunit B [Candidatus Zinderia endosymbiont of Aphrophora alni]|uniref:DNA gyrase subunit B n=1 Tax=Candidatus Zinderia endosymbiont of Aphrophora alni TaxID=3077951 RepID=UPI0030CCD9BC